MSKLTNTERVAVALFGFTPWDDPEMDRGYRAYRHPKHAAAYVTIDRPEYVSVNTGGYHNNWPDFADERLAPYWADRMQRELAALDKEKPGLMMAYHMRLRDVARRDASSHVDRLFWEHLASPTQRLESAVRVLEEVGL